MMIDDYVVDVLMRDLVGHDRQPTSFLIYVWLTFEAGRSRHERVQVSYQTVADSVGISKSAAQTGVQWLLRRKLIEVKKSSPTAVPAYRVVRPCSK
ncbi:MAG TPA: helix-turn-helix domain-containing protein [Candidatus Angelobacter sp.]